MNKIILFSSLVLAVISVHGTVSPACAGGGASSTLPLHPIDKEFVILKHPEAGCNPYGGPC